MIPQVTGAIIKWLESDLKVCDDSCDEGDGESCDNSKEDDIGNDDMYDEMVTYLTESSGIDWNGTTCSQFIHTYSYLIFDLCKSHQLHLF